MEKSLDQLEIDISNTVENTVEGARKTTRRVSNVANELKDHLIKNYPNGFTLENIMDLVIDAMQFLNKMIRMSGHQKRQCIIDGLLLLLDETNSGELEFYEPIIKSMILVLLTRLLMLKKKVKLNKRVKRGLMDVVVNFK